MTTNCKLDLPWLVPQPANNKTLIIVGGSPSLKDNMASLKMKARMGAHIMSTNGTLKFLTDKGTTPDFHAQFDARPENVGFVRSAPKNVSYLIGSMSDPSVLETLKDRSVILWHGGFDVEKQLEILEPYKNRPIVIVGGGYTIGMRAILLGFHLGYRKFVLYGVDSSFSGDKHHAYPQKLNDNDRPVVAAYQGKEYNVAPWMYRQAMNFEEMHAAMLKRGCTIKVVGEGLIPDMCKYLNEQNNVV